MMTNPSSNQCSRRFRAGVSCVFVALLLWVSTAALAYAQESELTLDPASGVYPIGEEFTVDVLLNTGGETINAAEGVITYAPDDLTVVSLAYDSSIFSMWMEKPAFDNEAGRIRFSGGTRSGFQGRDGRIMTITFRALRTVASQVWFSQGAAVHAADGQGSNVLSGLRSGTYTLTARNVVPSMEYVALANTPRRRAITSPTHPHEDTWYATSSAILRWEIPEDATAMRTALDQSPATIPSNVYPQPVSQIVEEELSDGENYFHLQFQNEHGWGEVMHRALRIDTTPPETLAIQEESRNESDPRVAFRIDGGDATSGIERYEMQIDDGELMTWDGDGLYRPSNIPPGEHVLTVYAYDHAGNRSQRQATFTVHALEPPQITTVPEGLLAGDTLTVQGQTYPNADVHVTYRHEGGEVVKRTVPSDRDGAFAVVLSDAARAGVYEARFRVEDSRGAQSDASEPVEVTVSEPRIVLFGSTAVSYLSIIVPLLGLVLLCLLVLWWGFLALRRMKRQVAQETHEVGDLLTEGFVALEDDLAGVLANLQRASGTRELTNEEQFILERLSGRLETLRKVLTRELADIDVAAGVEPDEAPAEEEAREQEKKHAREAKAAQETAAQKPLTDPRARAKAPRVLTKRRASPAYRRFVTNLRARRKTQV